MTAVRRRCTGTSLAVAVLVAALHCYDLRDARGAWQGAVIVDEEAWRFDLYDARGRPTESGQAETLPAVLKRLGLVEKARSCPPSFTPCVGRATRC